MNNNQDNNQDIQTQARLINGTWVANAWRGGDTCPDGNDAIVSTGWGETEVQAIMLAKTDLLDAEQCA